MSMAMAVTPVTVVAVGDLAGAIAQLLAGAACIAIDDPVALAEARAHAVGAPPALVNLRSLSVAGHARSEALSTVDDALLAVGVRKRIRQRVQLVLDELLMNALWDAPVDAAGRPRFAELAAADRGTVTAPPCRLTWGWRETRFSLAVTDPFGSLTTATALHYLAKCLDRPRPLLDDKPGGAGLGLYLVAHTADALYFTLQPGVSTSVTCVFDCAPHRARSGLQALGLTSTLR